MGVGRKDIFPNGGRNHVQSFYPGKEVQTKVTAWRQQAAAPPKTTFGPKLVDATALAACTCHAKG